MSRNDGAGRVRTPTGALDPSHRDRDKRTAVTPDVYSFAESVDLVMLGRALHLLRYDAELVVAARLGLELGDERRGIAAELKRVSLNVRGEADDGRWAAAARRHIQAAGTFAGSIRMPTRCDVCHARLSGMEGMAA